MQERHDSRRVGDEDRNAVSDSNSKRDSLLGGDMSIGFLTPEPTLPTAGVHDDPGTVNLPDRSQSTGGVSELLLHRRPATHYLVDRIRTGETESASFTSSREGTNPPTFEVGDYFFRD